jgi:hypothetical protein
LTATVIGSANVPVPPAFWWITGLLIAADPGGLLSQ